MVKVDSPPAQLALFFDPKGRLTAESFSPINTTLNQLQVLATSTSKGKPSLGQTCLRSSTRIIVK